jgi:hypothetical protein
VQHHAAIVELVVAVEFAVAEIEFVVAGFVVAEGSIN